MRSTATFLALAAFVAASGSIACSNRASPLQPGSAGAPAGTGGISGPSGSGMGGGGGAWTFMGVHAYTVTSTVSWTDSQFTETGANLPATQTVTLVLDTNARSAIVGAKDHDARPYQSNDDRTFQIDPDPPGGFTVPLRGGCYPPYVGYGAMTVMFADGASLTGTGTGLGCVEGFGNSVCAKVSMVFAGRPDVEAPTLTVDDSGGAVDPFVGATVRASEPLPPTTRPTMTSTSGDRFTLAQVPYGVPSRDAAATNFHTPNVLLRYGEGYSVIPDGIVDFAGNATTTPATFQTVAPPPLAAPDGFESVTGTSLGGAILISGAGNPVISGAQSLYVPLQNHRDTCANQTLLASLRLAVPAGATTIRFSYRSVTYTSSGPGTGFVGVEWASAGQPISSGSLPAAQNPKTFTMPDQTMTLLGPVTSAEFPLDASTGAEVALAFMYNLLGCSTLGPCPSVGIVIDDLRVE